MGSLIHIAEVAALIFVGYLAGWLVGYALHRVLAQPAKTTSAAASATVRASVAVQSPDDALVKAPVVVPVAGAAPPHVHARVTQIEPTTAVAVPDGMVLAEVKTIEIPRAPAAPVSAIEALKSLATAIPLARVEVVPLTTLEAAVAVTPVAEPDPAPIAEPLAGDEAEAAVVAQPVAVAADISASEPTDIAPTVTDPEPIVTPEPAAAALPLATEPEPVPVEPDPTPEEPEPVDEPVAMPSFRPGVAWSGAIKGREASPFERIAEVAADPVEDGQGRKPAGLDVTLLDSLADELQVDEPALPIDQLDALVPMTSNPEPLAAAEMPTPVEELEPRPAPEAVAVAAPEPVPEPAPQPLEPAPQPTPVAPPQPVQRDFDEDAAMRAIEGGWSRRQTRAMSDAYELTDVSAAVSAAQVAVEQVLAANGINPAEQGTRAQAAFGKPRGLPQPRNGRRDNLKQINGLGPLDESTLNNLGVYHFDQIAGWDQKEVLWMENHAFARGRIGREDWQGQARALIDDDAARRAGS